MVDKALFARSVEVQSAIDGECAVVYQRGFRPRDRFNRIIYPNTTSNNVRTNWGAGDIIRLQCSIMIEHKVFDNRYNTGEVVVNRLIVDESGKRSLQTQYIKPINFEFNSKYYDGNKAMFTSELPIYDNYLKIIDMQYGDFVYHLLPTGEFDVVPDSFSFNVNLFGKGFFNNMHIITNASLVQSNSV